MTADIICFVKARAPVNIAVIKYWGKHDTGLKIPLNDSLSGTLSVDDMCSTTSVIISEHNQFDRLILNGQEQDLTTSPARLMLDELRNLSTNAFKDLKVCIESENNFPTAAGLASSASGYACLAFVLGKAFGINDLSLLSRIARKGSGSACRSLFGGFVHWIKGQDDQTSVARQVADHLHWPEIQVLICVVKDDMKDVSSSGGMAKSVETSELLQHRASNLVPGRIESMKQAIIDKNFETFARITMQDSNQFHAICLDTYPPIFYLNEISRQIIKVCTLINEFYSANRVAYTFDAGPNACIFSLDNFGPQLIVIIQHFFPSDTMAIRGKPISYNVPKDDKFDMLMEKLCAKLTKVPDGIKYLINTSVGSGPEVLEFRSSNQN